MDVNGVTSVAATSSVQSQAKAESKAPAQEEKKASTSFSEEAAVYEKSEAPASNGKIYTSNPDLVAKLKADAEARTSQLQDIVNKLLTKQAGTFDAAQGLKKFYENLEVDEETRAQAQKDIADDGYWGVEQTSSRIFDFAMALTGGDPDKMEEMKDAFTKGFKQATKAWGDELPDISHRTADSVYKKFEDYQKQMAEQATTGNV